MRRATSVLLLAALSCLVVESCSSSPSTGTDTTGSTGQGGAGATGGVTSSTQAGPNATSSSTGAGSSTGSGYSKLPCNVMVGTGSGPLNIDATIGNPGDVICVEAGSYSGGKISGVSDRIIQNDGGLVIITDVVEISNLTNVTFSGSGDDALMYGLQLNGGAASFVITGPNSGLKVHNLEAVDAGIVLDAGHTNLMWTGDPSGLVLYQTVLDRIHLKHSDELFQGNYGSADSFLNFASDFEMANVIVEDSQGRGRSVVGGGGIFNLNAHDWTITGQNDVVVGSPDDLDAGVFLFTGSGSITHIHRDGGWGWLARNFGAQLGPDPGAFHCENNVDLNTEYYGTCESRNNLAPDTLVPGKLSQIDIFIQNNVSAHKGDIKGGYTTAIGLIPSLIAGTTVTLVNNVGCDNANDYGDMESLHFFGPIDGTVVKSNNQQLTMCTGLSDPITGLPL